MNNQITFPNFVVFIFETIFHSLNVFYIKDVMPVFFGQNCLHLYLYLSSKSNSLKYENAKYSYLCMLNITEK